MLSSRQMFEKRRARNRNSLKKTQMASHACPFTVHHGIFMRRLLMMLPAQRSRQPQPWMLISEKVVRLARI